jgi:hypothetical protein
MMQPNKFLLLLSLILLSSCSWLHHEPQLVPVTEYVEKEIAIVDRPKPVQLGDVQFYVVTEENLQEFVERFKHDNGALVFYAMSVRDYEVIALNIAELRRYINQQKEIIVYYEDSVAPKQEEDDDE